MIHSRADTALALASLGYFAGTADGIVTINGQPVSREITVMSAEDLSIVTAVYSLSNGHYLIRNLDPEKRYLLLCRPKFGLDDIGISTEVQDYVQPMNNLTLDEQNELWQQMTT